MELLQQFIRLQIMQGRFFAQKGPIKLAASSMVCNTSKPSPLIFSEDDFYQDNSNNGLNDAFIAEESKLLLSDSQSVVSQGLSISNISVIRRDSRTAEPMFCNKLEEEFSGLEDWSLQSCLTFKKASFKRPNPSIDQEDSEEYMENRCTKKKLGDKLKIVTLNSKTCEKERNQKGYSLRSRAKLTNASESSSNEELRQMIDDIEKQEIGAVQYKPKLKLK